MSDLISRSALIEDIKKQYDMMKLYFPQSFISFLQAQPLVEPARGECSNCSRRKFYQEGYEDGLNASKWTPVSERLPEGCESAEIEVLISTREIYPDAFIEESGFALYYPKTKTFHSVYGDRLDITEIVTAWKYLPEHYMRKKVE